MYKWKRTFFLGSNIVVTVIRIAIIWRFIHMKNRIQITDHSSSKMHKILRFIEYPVPSCLGTCSFQLLRDISSDKGIYPNLEMSGLPNAATYVCDKAYFLSNWEAR